MQSNLKHGSYLVLVAWLFIACHAARAQSLPPCPLITNTPGLKVVLDDVRLNPAGGAAKTPQDDVFMTRLRYQMESSFRDPQFSAIVTPLYCKRYPADKSLFDQGILRNLNDNNVVLELWGDVLPSTLQKQEAYITYLLVPVRFSEFAASGQGIYTVPHTVSTAPGEGGLMALFGQGKELLAYAFIALGVKQLRNQDYDAAKKNLTEGEFRLARAFGKNLDPEHKALLTYVHQTTCSAVRQARQDSQYVAKKGALALLTDADVNKICTP